jgi:hypothetical protein
MSITGCRILLRLVYEIYEEKKKSKRKSQASARESVAAEKKRRENASIRDIFELVSCDNRRV